MLYFIIVHFLLLTRVHELIPLLSLLSLVKVGYLAFFLSYGVEMLVCQKQKRSKESNFLSLLLIMLLGYVACQLNFLRHTEELLKRYLFFMVTLFSIVAIINRNNSSKDVMALLIATIFASLVTGVQFLLVFMTTVSKAIDRPKLETANGDPNLGGWIIGSSIPLCLYLMQRCRSKVAKLVWLLALLFLILSLLITFSRSAFLVMVLSLLLSSLFTKKSALLACLLVTAAVALVVVNPTNSERVDFLNIFKERTVVVLDQAYNFRVQSIATGMEFIAEFPLFGVGYEQSAYLMNRYVGMGPTIHKDSYAIHNGVVVAFAELGIIGGMFYLIPFVMVVAWSVCRKQSLLMATLLFSVLMQMTVPMAYSYVSYFALVLGAILLPDHLKLQEKF
ncbi:MAG: O-antigen ligase family protein [Oligoflexia bacterium]|nr:O-antigen ligase family protein [Oligoflexia bacterium]